MLLRSELSNVHNSSTWKVLLDISTLHIETMMRQRNSDHGQARIFLLFGMGEVQAELGRSDTGGRASSQRAQTCTKSSPAHKPKGHPFIECKRSKIITGSTLLTECELLIFSRAYKWAWLWPFSRVPSAPSFSNGENEALGLRRCSKMAMMRNIDIRIAVATKPNEMAFMDVPKSFRVASLSAGSGGAGLEFQNFGLSPNSFIVFCFNS